MLAAAAWSLPAAGVSAPADQEPAQTADEPLRTDAAVVLPSTAELEAKIKDLESATGPNEAGKTALVEQYRRTLANLESARAFDAKAAEYAQALEGAPKETSGIRKDLEAQAGRGATEKSTPPRDLKADEITQRLGKIQTESALLEARLSDLNKRIDDATARPSAARARILELKQTLSQLDAEPRPPVSEGQSADLTQAIAWALESRRQAQLAEVRATEQELASLAVREDLYRVRRDQAASDLERLKRRRGELEALQVERRKADAEQARRETEAAQREAAGKHPLVQQIADENAAITSVLGRLADTLDGLNAESTRLEQEQERIEDEYRGAQQRVQVVGLDKALGQVLIDRRSRLPDLRQYRKTIALWDDQIADATLSQIRYREEQQRLRDLDQAVTDLTAADPQAQTPAVRAELRALLDQRRPLLDKALAAEDAYVRKLGELNGSAQQLIQTVEDYDAFLAEHLLWVRSDLTFGIETLRDLPAALARILSPERWGEVLLVLAYELTHSPISWLGLMAVSVLFLRSPRIKRALLATAEPLRRVRTDRFRYSLRAFGLTLLAALPLPLLFLLLGRELAYSIEATAFTRALGRGLIQVSAGLYFLRAFRLLCIPGGIADRHFRWSTRVLTIIRRNLRWFTSYIIPVGLVTSAIYQLNDPSLNNGLGRLTLVATMIGVAVFFGRLFNPRSGILQGILVEHPEGWLNRLRNLWFAAIVGAPLALAVLTLMGYLYTSGTLFQALVKTAWLALALVVLQQTIVRWLILTRRRLALQAALDRQAARRAQARTDKAETHPKDNPILVTVEEPEVDLATLDEQTRKLVNALIGFASVLGTWWIWSDMLPAFNLLEKIPLWHYKGTVDGAEQLVPVSAADIGLVLVIVFIAVVAAKNLPALIEIVLLQATSVTAGSRYAAKTLVSYGITAAAFLTAFGALGLSWSQVQWLVAALGVGIGFGLQEIVANFISGLIILFERPVRVGDVVTIGDTTGVVTNIQIRATTVRNWDRQELVVPNKEFITGRLLNWTLTDQINRIVLNVGIEYGSNTDLALALLADVAAANPRVLKDPPPVVSFEGFGDNSLTVVLRCYLEAIEHRLSVTSELHRAIEKAFAANGIVIAFPQRDIHLTAREPIDIRLRRQPAGPRDSADPDAPPAPAGH